MKKTKKEEPKITREFKVEIHAITYEDNSVINTKFIDIVGQETEYELLGVLEYIKNGYFLNNQKINPCPTPQITSHR